MDFDNLDTCADFGKELTDNEKHENIDLCHE